MKIYLSLGLLAALTACGESKSSDKTPAAVTPSVQVSSKTPDLVEKTTSSDIVVVKPVSKPQETAAAENKPVETTPTPAPAATPTATPSVPKAEESAKPVPETFVGFGFNTTEKQVKESCVTGNVTVDASNSSSVMNFSRYENYEAFKISALDFKSGSILNKWAGVDFENQFFAEISAESAQANYVFATSVISGTKRINNTELTTTLSPSAFLNKCGNRYISTAVVGGAFVASVKLKFVNLDAKLSVESESLNFTKLTQLLKTESLNFTKLTQLLKTESLYAAESRRVASVEISYAQIGGGGALVPNLDSADLLSCSLDNAESVQKCVNTLEKLSSYAVSDAFLKSIQKLPAVYSFTLNKY